MYYCLKEPWGLRGYRGQLMYLDPVGLRAHLKPISMQLFTLLARCDGTTPLYSLTEAEQKMLSDLEEKGIVAASENPNPWQPWQDYRYFENKRYLTAVWGITGRCNARCRHCFMASDTAVMPSEYTWEECCRVISEMEKCGIRNVMLTGGEPLVHPDFFRIVHEIVQNGMRITRIYTNALLLKEETIQRLEEEGVKPEMMISFDGFGVHDWMRGVPGAEGTVLKAIAMCKKHGLSVRVSINLNTVTLGSVVPTVKKLAEMGVDNLFVIRTTQTPKWMDQGQKTLSYDEYLDTQLELVRVLRREKAWKTRIRFFNGMEVGPDTTAEDISKVVRVWFSEEIPECAWCNKCTESFFIASDGRVLPCDAFEGGTLAGNQMVTDNNVHNRPLRDILNNSEYSRAISLSVEEMLSHNPECRDCSWKEICHGGACRAVGIAALAVKAGSYHVDFREGLRTPEPIFCRFFKGGYFDRLKALLEET